MTDTDLATYQSDLIDHVRANACSPEEAVAAILPDYLVWTHTGYSGPDRSVGEQCGGFDDFEVDRERTPAWAVEAFEDLPVSVQSEIEEDAHEKALRDI